MNVVVRWAVTTVFKDNPSAFGECHACHTDYSRWKGIEDQF